jgi:hypothetical protein
MDRIKKLWSNESDECLTQKPGSRNAIHFANPLLIQLKNKDFVIESQPCSFVYVGITNTISPSSAQASEIARRVGNINHQFKHMRGTILSANGRNGLPPCPKAPKALLDPEIYKWPNSNPIPTNFTSEELDDLTQPYQMTVYSIEHPDETEKAVLAKFPASAILNKNKGTDVLPKLIYIIILHTEHSPTVTIPIHVRICYEAPNELLYAQLVKSGFSSATTLNYHSVTKPKFILREEIRALLIQVKQLNQSCSLSDEELLQMLHE